MNHLKLFENPDNLGWINPSLTFKTVSELPIPFTIFFDNDKKYSGVGIGKWAQRHESAKGNYNIINCRLWLKRRIISFWDEITSENFYAALSDIEKILTSKIEDGSFNEFTVPKTWKTSPKNDLLKKLIDNGVIKNEKFKIFDNDFKVDLEKDWDYEDKLIPLNQFVGGVGATEADKKAHNKSPMDKQGKVRDRFPGWKPKDIKYKIPGKTNAESKWLLKNMYQEKINEAVSGSPDSIYFSNWPGYGELHLSYSDPDARPFEFSVKDSKLNVGYSGSNHIDLDDRFDDKAYPGRIWEDFKIITFWVSPDEYIFKDICKQFEDKYNIKILNNNWKIVILKDNSKIKRRGGNQDVYYMDDDWDNYESDIIPVEEYAGSENVSDKLYQQHLDLTKNKKVLGKYGSKKDLKYKLPGELPVETKLRLKNMYQENMITKFEIFESPKMI